MIYLLLCKRRRTISADLAALGTLLRGRRLVNFLLVGFDLFQNRGFLTNNSIPGFMDGLRQSCFARFPDRFVCKLIYSLCYINRDAWCS